jgi:hypothetical protein
MEFTADTSLKLIKQTSQTPDQEIEDSKKKLKTLLVPKANDADSKSAIDQTEHSSDFTSRYHNSCGFSQPDKGESHLIDFSDFVGEESSLKIVANRIINTGRDSSFLMSQPSPKYQQST